MITNVITADKDKKSIFGKEYIEVLLPIGDEGLEVLEAKCPETLKHIHECLDDEDTEAAWVELKVAFDLANKKTHFYFITNCHYDNDYPNTEIESDIYGDFTFDSETAEYFKNKAIKELLNSLEAMANCEFKSN